MHQRIQPERAQAAQIQIENLERRGLDDDLVLIIVLQPERVVAVTTVRRTARRLQVRGAPRLRSNGPQEGSGMESTRAHLHIVGLQDDAPLLRPIALQPEYELLKRARRTADLHSDPSVQAWDEKGWEVYRLAGCINPLSPWRH